jgi:hypothetical protein
MVLFFFCLIKGNADTRRRAWTECKNNRAKPTFQKVQVDLTNFQDRGGPLGVVGGCGRELQHRMSILFLECIVNAGRTKE